MGGSNSGKSTFAQQLGRITGYPVLYMDQIAHIPGSNWVRDAVEKTGAKHHEFLKRDAWIIDGMYKQYLSERLDRADTVIILRAHKFRRVWRYLRRAWRDESNRPGNLERAEKEFNWSMVWWMLFRADYRPHFDTLKKYPHLKPIVLKSFSDMEKFLNTVSF